MLSRSYVVAKIRSPELTKKFRFQTSMCANIFAQKYLRKCDLFYLTKKYLYFYEDSFGARAKILRDDCALKVQMYIKTMLQKILPNGICLKFQTVIRIEISHINSFISMTVKQVLTWVWIYFLYISLLGHAVNCDIRKKYTNRFLCTWPLS